MEIKFRVSVLFFFGKRLCHLISVYFSFKWEQVEHTVLTCLLRVKREVISFIFASFDLWEWVTTERKLQFAHLLADSALFFTCWVNAGVWKCSAQVPLWSPRRRMRVYACMGDDIIFLSVLVFFSTVVTSLGPFCNSCHVPWNMCCKCGKEKVM